MIDGDTVRIGYNDNISVRIDTDGNIEINTPTGSFSCLKCLGTRVYLFAGFNDMVFLSEILLSIIVAYTVYMYGSDMVIGLLSLYVFILSVVYFTSFSYVFSLPVWLPVLLRIVSGYLIYSMNYLVGLIVSASWILYILLPCKYSLYVDNVDYSVKKPLESIVPLLFMYLSAYLLIVMKLNNISVLSTISYSFLIPVFHLIIIDSDREPGVDLTAFLLVINLFLGLVESILLSIYYLTVKRDKEFLALILLILIGLTPFVASIPFVDTNNPLTTSNSCKPIPVDPPVFRLVHTNKSVMIDNVSYRVLYVVEPRIFGYRYSIILWDGKGFYRCSK